MDTICWLDIVILLPLLFGLIMGLIRGLVAELNAVLAVILGVAGVRMWGDDLSMWIQKTCHWSQEICNIVACVVLFLTIVIVCTLLGKALQKLLKKIHLGWVNRLLGGVCGTVKWAIIVLVLVFITGQLDSRFHILPNDLKQNSRLYAPSLNAANHPSLPSLFTHS